MTLKKITYSLFVALVGVLLLASCTKENSVTVIETEVPISLGFSMAVNDTTVVTEAFAAYCQNDTVEFLIIANKQENLEFPFSTFNFEPDDFVYGLAQGDNGTWGFSGQALGSDVTGIENYLLISFSDALIEVDSNDGELVTGSAEGFLLGIDPEGNFSQYPYSMNFAAEIIQESNFCE